MGLDFRNPLLHLARADGLLLLQSLKKIYQLFRLKHYCDLLTYETWCLMRYDLFDEKPNGVIYDYYNNYHNTFQ